MIYGVGLTSPKPIQDRGHVNTFEAKQAHLVFQCFIQQAGSEGERIRGFLPCRARSHREFVTDSQKIGSIEREWFTRFGGRAPRGDVLVRFPLG